VRTCPKKRERPWRRRRARVTERVSMPVAADENYEAAWRLFHTKWNLRNRRHR